MRPRQGEKETTVLGVLDCTGGEQRLPIARPGDVTSSKRRDFDVGRFVPSDALKGRTIQNIDRRDVVVANREEFAVRTVSDTPRKFSARRLERLADAVEVGAVAVGIVLIRANRAIVAGRRETAVARESRAISWESIP